MSYASLSSHRTMALDRIRNAAYARALARVVTPETVVLDLGAGTGVLGLIAARLGARHVYLIEPEDVIALADEVVAAHGLEGRVTTVQGRIEDLELPEPVDVIVSALTGNFLVTEDLITLIVDARERLLKPGGTLFPSRAAMDVAPVSAPRAHADLVAAWATADQGVDLSAARGYAANTIFYQRDALADACPLAEAATVHAIDFSSDGYGPIRSEVTLDITSSGVCHGFAGWSRLELGSEWLSTAPWAPRVHWTPAFLPLDPPRTVERGARLSFSLERMPQGDWTWTAATGGWRARHSTLLSRPLTPRTLERAALDYQPRRNRDGEIVQHLLGLCDGTRSTGRLAEEVARRFPDRFASPTAALGFVQRVVARHG
jgi:hypothetical protein